MILGMAACALGFYGFYRLQFTTQNRSHTSADPAEMPTCTFQWPRYNISDFLTSHSSPQGNSATPSKPPSLTSASALPEVPAPTSVLAAPARRNQLNSSTPRPCVAAVQEAARLPATWSPLAPETPRAAATRAVGRPSAGERVAQQRMRARKTTGARTTRCRRTRRPVSMT